MSAEIQNFDARAAEHEVREEKNQAPVECAGLRREIHSRHSDGINVGMYWLEATGAIYVEVNDTRSGEAFRVDVPEDARALDVFHHPYAYAAQCAEN